MVRIEEIKEALRGLQIGETLVIRDLSRYKPETSRTGGDYLFGVKLLRVDEDLYLRRYFTSAEFPFCGVTGYFTDHPCYPDDGRLGLYLEDRVVKGWWGCWAVLRPEEAEREVEAIGWPHLLHEATEIEVLLEDEEDLEALQSASRRALKALLEVEETLRWADDE